MLLNIFVPSTFPLSHGAKKFIIGYPSVTGPLSSTLFPFFTLFFKTKVDKFSDVSRKLMTFSFRRFQTNKYLNCVREYCLKKLFQLPDRVYIPTKNHKEKNLPI